MARMADSERVIWELRELARKLTEDLLDLKQENLRLGAECLVAQQMLAVLARRQAGTLIIFPDELASLPPGASVCRVDQPDGRVFLRAVSDESAEPGSPG
jgi:hypothetical protein